MRLTGADLTGDFCPSRMETEDRAIRKRVGVFVEGFAGADALIHHYGLTHRECGVLVPAATRAAEASANVSPGRPSRNHRWPIGIWFLGTVREEIM